MSPPGTPAGPGPREIRVVIIDDSAYNRQTLAAMLEAAGIKVVARAADGDEGLRMVFAHQPDVITLDLEMPKMDGFTFLRLLMAKRPTPVIVVSSNARKESLFKALELGAMDVVAKPTARISPELREIEGELLQKVRQVARLRPVSLAEHVPRMRQSGSLPPGLAAPASGPGSSAAPAADRPGTAPATAGPGLGMAAPGTQAAPGAREPQAGARGGERLRLVVIGASTGGPPALMQIVQALPRAIDTPMAMVVGLHMPAKFTTAFAERLGRAAAWPFREARAGELVEPGAALVAPGGSVTTLVRDEAGALRVKIDPPAPGDHFMPSIDRLFESAAAAGLADRLLGVVLTGMGGDGARGVRAIRDSGGRVIAESAETAVIFGMPEEAIRTGAVAEVLPLPQIGALIARFAGAVVP